MKKVKIQAKNLCFSYYKKPLCLRNFNVQINVGEKILVLGHEGEGKTTLLKILSGFETGYFGNVSIDGTELKKMPDSNRNVSLLFDDPVLIKSTIRKNIDFMCNNNNLQIITDSEFEELQTKFNMEKEDSKIKKLSLFEKRKVALIRSFIKDSECLFLDDQFKGNDKSESKELISIINECFAGKTMVLSADAETFLNNRELFDEFKFDKVMYLSLLNAYEYKSISAFLEDKVNFDAVKFNNDVNIYEGFVIKQQGQFYFSNDNGLVLKFDKDFYPNISNMKVNELENENVYLCALTSVDLENITSEEFNKMLKGKQLFIYSYIDGSKVV